MEIRLQAANPVTFENPVHDDSFARLLGFRGGLVPGVDLYGYMARLPESLWGSEWSAKGSIWARFLKPVYDGEQVTVRATEEGPQLRLELLDAEGELRCAGGAQRVAEGPAAAVEDLPLVDLPALPGPPDFVEGQVLGSLQGPLEMPDGAWPARQANRLLMANARLPPWIHVESRVRHLALPRIGQPVSVRGRIVKLWERKQHRFAELEVLVVGAPRQPLAELRHVAIYELAQLR